MTEKTLLQQVLNCRDKTNLQGRQFHTTSKKESQQGLQKGRKQTSA